MSAAADPAPHVPVLIRPLIDAVSPVSGVWLDGTFGAGGYTRALLAAGADRVIAVDRDPLPADACLVEPLQQALPARRLLQRSRAGDQQRAAGVEVERDQELLEAEEIFLAVGEVVILDESHLDAVTGLSGSGPAYVFSFVEALIDAGVKSGLTRAVSEKLALQTVSGSVKLLKESGEHPAALRGKVTSPGGTAITALHVLEKVGFHGIIMDIVESAVNRSKELGKLE